MRKRQHILTKAEAADLSEADIDCCEQLETLMNELIDELILNRSMTTNKIAEEAHLAVSTVDRMVSYQTKFPRYHTVAKLAHAAGWRLSLNKQRIKLIRKAPPKRRVRLKVA